MSDSFGSIFLKEGRDSSIRHRHPWIFSGAIERASKEFEEGDIARICDSKGEVLGFGHVAPGTIALKVLQFGGQEFDVGVFCRQKIQEALWLRAGLGLLNSKTTTAFRLLHAEGDGMPGLVADYYAGTVVLQFHSMGMLLLKEQIVAALQECLGQKLHCVYQQETTIEGAESGPECAASYLFGEAPTHQFLENGLHFQADWEQGQKTGFFLDQRENRELLRKLAPGRTVLNCFSYTGGFSCAALAGGASKVVSVDSSALALAKAKEVVEKNFPEAKHECIEADCLQFLREIGPGYDCIVLDPPAFIKHRGAYKGGIKGYETINTHALKQIESGGLLFTFSCSQLLQRSDFLELMQRSALRANRNVRIVAEMQQAPCHPVALGHPEGRYLKGLVLEVR